MPISNADDRPLWTLENSFKVEPRKIVRKANSAVAKLNAALLKTT
jgi:hypothetical protein